MYFFRRTIYRNFTLNGNLIKVGGKELERVRRFELPTNGLGSRCATTALHPLTVLEGNSF